MFLVSRTNKNFHIKKSFIISNYDVTFKRWVAFDSLTEYWVSLKYLSLNLYKTFNNWVVFGMIDLLAPFSSQRIYKEKSSARVEELTPFTKQIRH